MVQKHQNRKDKVKDGIDFLLSHFEGKQRLFPRKMSTFASNGKQFTVYNREQILQSCRISQFKDCRLNAYPVLEEGLLQAPNIIFIDLDLPTGSQDHQDNLKELEKNLDKTLKIIRQRLNRFEPTVLWTGNGYHIYMVLDVRPLEWIEEFRELSVQPSEQFLRFAESTFTKKKKDSHHNPSFKSCLLRLPDTINSKNDSEVKIIQRFDKNKISYIYNHQLFREFRLYLADIDIRKKSIAKKKTNKNRGIVTVKNPYHSTIQYGWIEQLLETPIEDGRKYVLWRILCPYLVNVRKLKLEQTYEILKRWLEKCNNLRQLDFNPDVKIKAKLRYVKHYNPISIKKMKDDNKNLNLLLRQKL